MRTVRGVCLVAAMALAAVALAGVSSAGAATVLCSSGEQPCSEANRYPAGAFQAASGNAVISTNIVNINCSASALKGETTAASGSPLPMKFNTWSLEGCKTNSGTKCTATEFLEPASGSLQRSGENEGLVSIGSSASGEPGWNVKCGFLINCTFSAAHGLDMAGGNLSENQALKRTGGFCPSSASFSATYTISTPSPVYVASGDPVTTLCAVDSSQCFETDSYGAGTQVKASSSAVTIGSANYPTLTCSSSISGETGVGTDEGLPMSIDGWMLSGCKTPSGTTCTATAVNAPYPASVSWLEGTDGVLTIEDSVGWHLVCGYQLNCTITFDEPEGLLQGGSPAILSIEEVEGTPSGGTCLKLPRLTAGFEVTSPSPLYVSRA